MISHRRRFLFVHVPRTGGTSLNQTLRDDSCELLEKTHHPGVGHAPANHLTLHEIVSHGVVDRERLRSYFKFCFVRNPWDRLISEIHCRWIRFLFDGLNMEQSIHKACEIAERPTGYGNHLRPQSDFLASGDLEMDFVGRFENLARDFDAVRERIGAEAALPFRNRSRHRSYRTYYNRETRDLVAKTYREDVERFGYVFAPEE